MFKPGCLLHFFGVRLFEHDCLGDRFFVQRYAPRSRPVVYAVSITQRADNHALAPASSVYEMVCADENPYMGDTRFIGVLEENKITCAKLVFGYGDSLAELLGGGAGKEQAPLSIYALCQSGAVDAL